MRLTRREEGGGRRDGTEGKCELCCCTLFVFLLLPGVVMKWNSRGLG
uniref:Uncharacterized protein n=1 Tax=Vitis vinifera TaxID=29760 RepID=F6I1F1_VITVI